jgi:hypothetical protein
VASKVTSRHGVCAGRLAPRGLRGPDFSRRLSSNFLGTSGINFHGHQTPSFFVTLHHHIIIFFLGEYAPRTSMKTTYPLLLLALAVIGYLLIEKINTKPEIAPSRTASQPRAVEPRSNFTVPDSAEQNSAPSVPETSDRGAATQSAPPQAQSAPVASQSIPQNTPVPPASANPPAKPELADPGAREALSFVGADPNAEAYWVDAINDPSLSAHERQDLIEDLNEDGFADPKHPSPDEFPLIMNRLALIEMLAPDAMDQVNEDAFQEAAKDLQNMALKAVEDGGL